MRQEFLHWWAIYDSFIVTRNEWEKSSLRNRQEEYEGSELYFDDLALLVAGPAVHSFGNSGVYVINAVGTGRYKIGFAKDVTKRIDVMQTGCPYEMVVVNVFDVPMKYEHRMHKLLAIFRVQGEWFKLPTNVVDWIRGMSDG